MAPGDVLIGRRLPVIRRAVRQSDGSVVVVERMTTPTQPGEYCGPLRGYTGDALACFFLKPHARDPGTPAHGRSIQHVCFPPHTFRECADGSLEIRASIGETRSGMEGDTPDGWHGYLDEGHRWRQV